MRWSRFWFAALVCALATFGFAQGSGWRERFEVFTYEIAVRDGVELFTLVYVPKGKPGPFPILLERTPYGAGSPERGPQRNPPLFAEAGYIMAFQDVRGTGESEGEFVNVRPILPAGQSGVDESTDTWDTVDFLVKNVPNNNGNVGLWGISYPGFYAGAGAVRGHPALQAVSPQAPVNDWFLGDDVYHRGAFFLQETFDFAVFFDVPRGEPPVEVDREGLSAYEFFLKTGALSNFETKFIKGRIPYWSELMENDTYNAYWQSRALWRSFTDVDCAVLTVGGWYDKEDLFGALKLYKAAEAQNPDIPNYLVMGPWSHGQWAGGGGGALGGLAWGSATSEWYQETIEFPFFERYLRGQDVDPPAEATVFETGANAWRTFEQWPPAEAEETSLYIGPDGTLSWSAPASAGKSAYLADPAKPTPYLEEFERSRRAPGDWLARNQKFTQGRPDTVTFALPPLEEDVRIAGPIVADLWIETTGSDADLVVKVIDEHPADSPEVGPREQPMAGFQHMVRGEIMRAKFRNSFEEPEAIVPGRPTRVRFELNDVMHTFKKGHRIIVRVQSYWFPIADRNPNVFLSIPKAKDEDFRAATVSVLHGGGTPSRLLLGMMP